MPNGYWLLHHHHQRFSTADNVHVTCERLNDEKDQEDRMTQVLIGKMNHNDSTQVQICRQWK